LEVVEMHKILFSILMALILALALVGVKKVVQGDVADTGSSRVVATGTMPAPPIPW
jgi:hypothetical protein